MADSRGWAAPVLASWIKITIGVRLAGGSCIYAHTNALEHTRVLSKPVHEGQEEGRMTPYFSVTAWMRPAMCPASSGWNPDNGYRESVAERTTNRGVMAQLSALTGRDRQATNECLNILDIPR